MECARDKEAGAELAGWLPVELDPLAGKLQAVRVENAASLDLDLPFYHHALEALPTMEARPERTLALDAVAQNARRPPRGMIFHASRCGSTLIAQAIAALAGNTVIAEAQPINAALYLGESRAAVTAALLGAMGQWRPEDDIYIKQTSINVIRAAGTLADFPEANWVFAYRDPVEIMVSLAQSEAGWTRARHEPERAAWLLRVRDDLSAMPTEDYFALGIERMFRAALELDPERGLFIDYADLSQDGVLAAVRHLGVDITPERRVAIAASLGVYSKDRCRTRPHTDDRASKQAAATPAMRRAAERAAAAFDELRARTWRPAQAPS